MFLPITFVHRDKNHNPVVGKDQPANNTSGTLQSSPQETSTVTAQSHSTTKGESDPTTAQPPDMTRRNDGASQPSSMKRRDSDTAITAQPRSLAKKDEMSSKRKVQHDYETLLDLVMYVHMLAVYLLYSVL